MLSGFYLVRWVLADGVTDLKTIGAVAQAFAGILAGLIAVLGVPLALRQIVNLQREFRRMEFESRRRLDAEAILNISADYSLTRPAHDLPHAAIRAAKATMMEADSPAPHPGGRDREVLRVLDPHRKTLAKDPSTSWPAWSSPVSLSERARVWYLPGATCSGRI